EICAGVGMLGEGLRAGLARMGIDTRVCCYLEREAYPAAVLAARMQDGALDAAPVWSDILTFDAGAWAGAVDCVVAGFPCQDLSLAGRRAGLDGKRSGLFFDILDIAHACGARYLFLENVAGIASATASVVDEAEGALDERAAARVLGELADRGWNAEWLTLSASDVGASHGRARWFCFAWRQLDDADSDRSSKRPDGRRGHDTGDESDWCRYGVGKGCEILVNPGLQHQHLQQREDGAEHKGTSDLMECEFCGYQFPESCGRYGCPNCEGDGLADPERHGRHQGRPEPGREQGRSDAAERRGAVADSGSPRQQGRELGTTRAGNRGGRKHMDQLSNFVAHSSHLAQPTPDGQSSCESGPDSPQPSTKRLNPAFGEWLMGWPIGHTIAEPSASSASEMASWRCKLRQRLSYLFAE
nr:DNA cytosine methyltransferase [Burkholderiaceae bacterium]